MICPVCRKPCASLEGAARVHFWNVHDEKPCPGTGKRMLPDEREPERDAPNFIGFASFSLIT